MRASLLSAASVAAGLLSGLLLNCMARWLLLPDLLQHVNIHKWL